jgi:hypothetical protein
VPGDTNRVSDIFVRDRLLARTIRVSLTSNDAQSDCPKQYTHWCAQQPAMDDLGLVIAFQGTNLVPGDTNDLHDVFVRDRRLSPR